MERRLFNELSQFCFTYQEDDDIWFVAENYSLIFQACIKDCSIKRIIRMEDMNLEQTRQYCKLVKVENKIVVLPCDYNKIVIFNMENDRFSTVNLNKNTSPSMSYIKEGSKLYLINNTEIIILNIEHENVEEYVSIPYQDIINVIALKIDGHILIPLVYKDQILDFHISDKQFTCLPLECETNGFTAGVLDGTDVWLAGCNGDIVRWNYINRKCTLYNKFPEDFESFDYDKEGNFISWGKGWRQGACFKYWYICLLIDDKVWFFPFLSDSLLYFDKRTNVIHKYSFKNEDETESTMKSHQFLKFSFIGIQDQRYIKIYSVKRDIIYSVDTVTLNYTEETFDIDKINAMNIENEFKSALYRKASTEGILENKNVFINDLMSVTDENRTSTDIGGLSGQIGIRIYQEICGCIK